VPPPAELSYQIEGGTLLQGGYLHELGHAGIQLHFAEGSQIAFDPGARGRIRAIDQEGAHLAVDHGKAAFQIHKHEGRRWLIEAGPFLVTVKGTIFTITWDPNGERFELRLRQGNVAVSGPTSKRDIDLEAGQRLVVNLANAETTISEDRPDGNDVAAGAPAVPAGPTVDPPPPPATPARFATRSPAKPATAPITENRGGVRWAGDFAQGRWDHILKDAESGGIEATLDKASLDDLFILADAARYRHRPELARAALLAERRRFPEAQRTLAATFLLGRVEESRAGRYAQAIAWYDEYLAHTPTGSLAAEALGRKLMLTAELHGPARARPLAVDYLRRFPNGSYARSARLLQDPPAPGTP